MNAFVLDVSIAQDLNIHVNFFLRKFYKERGLITEEEMATYRKSMKSPNYPYE